MEREHQLAAWTGGRLALASTVLVVLIACGGAEAPGSEDMEAEAADAGMTSDFVSRPLPNPTAEMILNWAPLPDGRDWGSTGLASTSAPMATSGHMTAAVEVWTAAAKPTQRRTRCSSSIGRPERC